MTKRFQLDCNESRLKSFLDDRLAETDIRKLTEHLDHCERCRQTLEDLAAGSRLWGELRELAPDFGQSKGGNGSKSLSTETVGRELSPSAATLDESFPLDFLDPPAVKGSFGQLGPYAVSEVLGRGGFGIVLKALEPALGRYVAIKVLAPQLAASAASRNRFAREAKAAAAVVHENVVAIHAVDSWKGLPYLVMPCINGRSLQERVNREGPLSVKEVLRVGMQAALGLAAAHEQGLVHRDIKPSNILLENGVERVKLSDFGLARAVDDASRTQSGVIAGTPQYMSPEQARGETVDHRSDLFSLGSVLYFLCTGHSPFRADSTPAVLRRVSEDKPRPIRQSNPDIPGWLAEIVDDLLAKAPENRPATATEVADLLKHHLAELQRTGTSTSLKPAKATSSTRRNISSRSALMIGSAVAALLLITSCATSESPRNFLYGIFGTNESISETLQQSSGVSSSGTIIVQTGGDSPKLIEGSGTVASKEWDVKDFDEVSIGSAFVAKIVKGDKFKVTTTADDNILPLIDVKQDGHSLKVGIKPNQSLKTKTRFTVDIELPVLLGLELGGSARGTVDGFKSGAPFDLKIHGASKLDGSIDVGVARVKLDGSSELRLKGSAQSAKIHLAGASRLIFDEFPVKDGLITLDGSSTAKIVSKSGKPFKAILNGASHLDGLVEAAAVELTLDGSSEVKLSGTGKDTTIAAKGASVLKMSKFVIDGETLKATVDSSSTLELTGKAKSAVIEGSGASSLRLGKLAVENATVKLSGSATATVEVKEALMYDLSGGAQLKTVGHPKSALGKKSSGADLSQVKP